MSTLPIFIKRCNCFNTKEHLLCLGHCCENNIVTWLLIILLKDQQQHEDPKPRLVVMLLPNYSSGNETQQILRPIPCL